MTAPHVIRNRDIAVSELDRSSIEALPQHDCERRKKRSVKSDLVVPHTTKVNANTKTFRPRLLLGNGQGAVSSQQNPRFKLSKASASTLR
jgi:hypothetical protein